MHHVTSRLYKVKSPCILGFGGGKFFALIALSPGQILVESDLTLGMIQGYCKCKGLEERHRNHSPGHFHEHFLSYSWISWPLQMEPISCPKTYVRNCHYTLRNNPEEHRHQLLRDGSLKICTVLLICPSSQRPRWYLKLPLPQGNYSLFICRCCKFYVNDNVLNP